MLDKNILLAMALSVLVLLLYNVYQAKYVHPPAEQAAEQAAKKAGEAPAAPKAGPAKPQEAAAPAETPGQAGPAVPREPEREVVVDTSLYTAVISSDGATIKSWKLKKYKDAAGKELEMVVYPAGVRPLLVVPDGMDEKSAQFLSFKADKDEVKLTEKGAEAKVTFTHEGGGGYIKKSVVFKEGSYATEIAVESKGYGPYTLYMGESFGSLTTKAAKGYGHFGPLSFIDGEIFKDNPEDIAGVKRYTGKAGWSAITDKYFMAAIAPGDGVDVVIKTGGSDWGLVGAEVKGPAAEKGEDFLFYAGPKEYDNLKALGRGLGEAVNFGWFAFIAKPLFVSLKFFYDLVGNYGWSIIIITFIIKLIFAPLTHKSQKSMKKMQLLQPLFAELKEKHKGDPAKLNQEMMEIYKKHKVNPLGGCLPMVIQIPVFIALYNVLQNAIELRQAPFMWWLTDLAAKDPYYVLPVLMGLSMFAMQKMTPTSADPKQNKIMMIMPVVLTFMFINLPSGLVLYFTVSNILSMAQQLYINKYSMEGAG